MAVLRVCLLVALCVSTIESRSLADSTNCAIDTINDINTETQTQLDNIDKSIEEIESQTCIRFSRSTAQHYVRIFKGTGCWSFIGRTEIPNQPYQELSLGGNCAGSTGVITHELIHAIGFFHEQSRPDRDNYVTIHFENVQKDFEGEFEKREGRIDSLDIDYDINSVMHYSNRIFSKNNMPTISSIRDPNAQLGGNKMTVNDAQQIRRLYEEFGQCDLPCKDQENAALSSYLPYCSFFAHFGYCGYHIIAANCARSCCLKESYDQSKI